MSDNNHSANEEYIEKKFELSVVIPTLGNSRLEKTINALYDGTLIPSEVLICIPKEYAHLVQHLSNHNIKIISTDIKGQVAQRAIGFRHATFPLVLQLDEDIQVRINCLQNLVNCINQFPNVSVGPNMYDLKTGEYHSYMVSKGTKDNVFKKFLFWVINGSAGFQPGQISKAGINMGVPKDNKNWNNLGWLPGGCILHWRENLILTNYYPFKGKAYAEDLFHSYLLRKTGVSLLRCGLADCDVDFSTSTSMSIVDIIKEQIAAAKVLTRFVREIGGSLIRYFLFLPLNFIYLSSKKIPLPKI